MIGPPRTDAEIIAGSLKNPDEFREVFARYYDTIFRFTARRVGWDLAADLTAEVFVRAFQLRARYDTSRPLCRPWLYGIAWNVVGDHLRRRKLAHRVGLNNPLETADPFVIVDDRLTAEARADVINDALSQLRNKDRDVLLMYALEELSYAEIAEALAIPVGTVRSRLARARRKMRELLPELAQTQSPNEEAGGARSG